MKIPNLMTVSPSALKTHDLCARLWGFVYLDKIRKPSTAAQSFGIELHAHAEQLGKNPEYIGTGPAWELLLHGKNLIPKPGASHYETEKEFWYRPSAEANFQFHGFIDLLETDRATDYKTAKGFYFALKPRQLLTDEQALIYGGYLLSKNSELESVRVRWIYFNKVKGRERVRQIHQTLTRDLVDTNSQNLIVRGNELVQLKANFKRAIDVPLTSGFPHSGCRAFGGCQHFEECEDHEKRIPNMSILEKLKAQREADEQAGLLAAMPIDIEAVRLTPEKLTAAVKRMYETQIPHLKGHVAICDTAEELALAELAAAKQLIEASQKKNDTPAAKISGIIPSPSAVVEPPKPNGEEIALAKEMYEPVIKEIDSRTMNTPKNSQLVHDFSKLKKADMVKAYGKLIDTVEIPDGDVTGDVTELEAARTRYMVAEHNAKDQASQYEISVKELVEQHKAELQLVVDHANKAVNDAREEGPDEPRTGVGTTYINCSTSQNGTIDIALLGILKDISVVVCDQYALSQNENDVPSTITDIPFGKGKALFNEAVSKMLKSNPRPVAMLDTSIDLMDWCQQAFVLNSGLVVKGRG